MNDIRFKESLRELALVGVWLCILVGWTSYAQAESQRDIDARRFQTSPYNRNVSKNITTKPDPSAYSPAQTSLIVDSMVGNFNDDLTGQGRLLFFTRLVGKKSSCEIIRLKKEEKLKQAFWINCRDGYR